MEYLALLSKCKDGPIEKVYIEGGQTEGRLKFTDPPPKPKGKSIMSGFQYANEVKLRERLEDIQIDENKQGHSMQDVEDLTSVGTLPNFNDLLPEQATQVYENYSFDVRSDKRLLIHDYQQEILDQINANQVTIIKGVTGCGKTTQVPQFILDESKTLGLHCNIIVTQPRRIAAVSVAKRVSQERSWPLGSIVGYKIGLEKSISPDTRLCYVTTGVLLENLIMKQSLSDFTHILIDEVHDRDSDTDFLLILVKKFIKSPNCRTKIVLMSATMNIDPFRDYFTRTIIGMKSEPPVIELSSSTKFPIQYYYLDNLKETLPHLVPEIRIESPGIEDAAYNLARQLIEIFAFIDQKEHTENDTVFRGSVLVFLPGLAQIETMYEVLTKVPPKSGENWWICPLHSSVTHEEQQSVFKPPPKGSRKIILATNVAESSITVIDVKYVIDFCLTKHQVTDEETGYSALEMTWISKSQGTQRAGRVGRVMPGRVYRFLSKFNYQSLYDQSPPEITRCPLDILILKAKQLSIIGSPQEILGLAIDPPDFQNIHKTILKLKEMGALNITLNGKYEDNDGDLTYLGHVMSKLPLDPKLSKLIMLGHVFSLLSQAIIMACSMSVKSIFNSPFKQYLEAYNSKLSWADCSSSDPIAFLNAYSLWRHKTKLGFFGRAGGQSESDWCKSVFIQKKTIKEVSVLVNEVHIRLRRLGIEETAGDAKVGWDEVEKSLILKLIIAGAFYPNYFVPMGVDEQEAVKILSGRDPFNTVYLTGLPSNQPGRLYVHEIKNNFRFCGSDIKLYFDGSSKVYLNFGSSITEKECGTDSSHKNLVPGKINLPVYRAVKLRQLGIPVVLHLLKPQEAAARANAVFGDLRKRIYGRNKEIDINATKKKCLMPAVTTNILSVRITYIKNPSYFWVSINDEMTQRKILWLHQSLNCGQYNYPPLKIRGSEGQLCIARFQEDKMFYRAKVLKVIDSPAPSARVIFIDYGNEDNISANDLKEFPPNLIDIKEEPPICIQASLAQVEPAEDKNAKGGWANDATRKFKNFFRTETAIAKVYSAVNNVLSLIMFDKSNYTDFPFTSSFNQHLINMGYAVLADEPYLSREDHMKREAADTSQDSSSSYSSDSIFYSAFEPAFENFDPVKVSECRTQVTLKGPWSPLEQKLFSLPKKCRGKNVNIEWNSVNSVLLDTNPMDPHERLVVAASVTQANSSKLTLRNTTIMPNLHGLASLICLLFAPRVELRADSERKSLTGALCGLGFDPETGASFYPENDMDITFDADITNDDLTWINRLRFWMDHMMGNGDEMERNLSRPDIVNAQRKIKEYVLLLIHTRRARKIPTCDAVPFEWDQIPSEELLDPHGKTKNLFPLIWGINLNVDKKENSSLLAQIETLEKYGNRTEIMRGATHCPICLVCINTLPELKIHLSTNQHKVNKDKLLRSLS